MRFEWDEAKDLLNLAKHKIGFETASLVFDDPHALSAQDRTAGGEERWQTLGMIGGGLIVLVAHTYRKQDGQEAIRIISARKATPRERRAYEDGYQEAG